MVDVDIFAGPTWSSELTGASLLASRVALHFLMRRGAVPHTTSGSSFVARLQTAVSEADVLIAANIAASEVRDAAVAEETALFSDDEKIDRIRIRSVVISESQVSLRIGVTAKSGAKGRASLNLTSYLRG